MVKIVIAWKCALAFLSFVLLNVPKEILLALRHYTCGEIIVFNSILQCIFLFFIIFYFFPAFFFFAIYFFFKITLFFSTFPFLFKIIFVDFTF
jgi:hypothetical protein